MLALWTAAALAAAPPPIIGGEVTSRWPAVASVEVGDGVGSIPVCSGTLIRPRWVLTAAHCVAELRALSGEALSPQVRFGDSLFAPDPADLVAVSDLYAHPDWRPDEFEHDLGLLFLERAADVEPVALADDDMTVAWEGRTLTFAGWGVQSDDDDDDGQKRQLDMTVTEADTWLLRARADAPDNLCHGDSGGPAFDASTSPATLAAVAAFVYQDDDRDGCTGGATGAVRARIAQAWVEVRIDGGTSYGKGLPVDEERGCSSSKDADFAWILLLPLGPGGLRRRARGAGGRGPLG